ncbi:MAG: hypothetical protein ABJA98_19595 [Acidobacteriota bacterium]
MRLPSPLRLGIALCGAVLLCLFSIATADAGPSHARAASHKQCGGKQTPCRVKARSAKAGQAASPYFVRVQRLVRRHPGSWLERSRTVPLRQNDDAALQDRTAVVSGEDDLLVASLEAIGVLSTPRWPLPISVIIDRHSPRGPPVSPGFV